MVKFLIVIYNKYKIIIYMVVFFNNFLIKVEGIIFMLNLRQVICKGIKLIVRVFSFLGISGKY